MKPYYEHAGKCECGCDGTPNRGKRFISGHNVRGTHQSIEHRAKIARALRGAWKAGGRKRFPLGSKAIVGGYVRVKVVEGSGYWLPEHILVMEKELGRELFPEEIVHHIDVVRVNNGPQNLHVFPNVIAHNEAHRSLNDLVADLLADGIIFFDRITGTYKRCR